MKRIRLIHWDASEAAVRGERLRAAGYAVDRRVPGSSTSLAALIDDLPDAFVIDLGRYPAHGRYLASLFRQRQATRHVPIVFAGGKPDKVERTRRILPDAAYVPWDDMERALEAAIARPPADPVVPVSESGAYSGTPLVRKLGIGAGTSVASIQAPDGFAATLGELPDGATLDRRPWRECDLLIWFVASLRTLDGEVGGLASVLAPRSSLWIAWPKKASGVATDVSQKEVRRIALAAGLVDYKVCAIDATWSGLRFTRRRTGGRPA